MFLRNSKIFAGLLIVSFLTAFFGSACLADALSPCCGDHKCCSVSAGVDPLATTSQNKSLELFLSEFVLLSYNDDFYLSPNAVLTPRYLDHLIFSQAPDPFLAHAPPIA